MVVGVAVAGLALATAAALAPWTGGAAGGAYPHVVRLQPPAVTAPRG